MPGVRASARYGFMEKSPIRGDFTALARWSAVYPPGYHVVA